MRDTNVVAVFGEVSMELKGAALLSAAVDGEEKRKRASELIYAERRLSAWAEWAKGHRHELGYPSVSLLYKAIKQKATPIKKRLERQLTARGKETVVQFEPKVDEPPEAVLEVEDVVSKLPRDLNTVIVADYFGYGPIEARAKKTPWKRARFSQLLESAKYAVYMALDSRTR